MGVLAGRAIVGLTAGELERLAQREAKLSTRDLAAAVARGTDGGTTVAATIHLATRAGLRVTATGGIGGVHPGPGTPDVSADLIELARTPIDPGLLGRQSDYRSARHAGAAGNAGCHRHRLRHR